MNYLHCAQRLERLANKLVGEGPYTKVGPVPKHKFDLKHWWMEFSRTKSKYNTQGYKYPPVISFSSFNPNECGTSACAMGWAAVDPILKKYVYVNVNGCHVLNNTANNFGLTYSAYDDIVLDQSYKSSNPTRRQVAERIRKYAKAIRKNKKVPQDVIK